MKAGILLKLVLPIVAVIILFSFNKLAGVLGILIYIAYLLYSGIPRFYAMAGKKRYDAGDMKGALELFEKSYKSGRASNNLKISYAYILLKAGEVDRANDILTPMLNQKMTSEGEISLKSNYALVLWKKGDIAGAVEVMEKLLNMYKNTIIYENLGYFLMLKGDLDRALEVNLEGYQYNNEDKVILDNLGQNYYLKGENDKARETYEELMEKAPGFPEPYYYYGCVLMNDGKYEEALDTMKKGIEYKFSPLSTIEKSHMEEKIKELEKIVESQGSSSGK